MNKKVRNFSIIAHIDHGKSTLADRMIELTKTVENRKMKDQILDRMDLERERGITIKLQGVTMKYKDYIINLIDTPGHVDFSYEVSRSLAAVESVVLLVDAAQGIQAQTLANLYLAINQNLVVIPVINKIDLPAAQVDNVTKEIINLLGCKKEDISLVSAKTGKGVEELLNIVVAKTPAPNKENNKEAPFRALIFDSSYDSYKGVVAHVRVMDGEIEKDKKIFLMGSKIQGDANEVGVFSPDYKAVEKLVAGDIGYIITGFKDVGECRVGDTVALARDRDKVKPLKGYEEVKPMVFAGIFPQEGNELKNLREAMDKLKLNDSALSYEPEHSEALGVGFRCGFLGVLHLEIVVERLRREYDLELIVTVPSVAYKVCRGSGEELIVRMPQKLPPQEEIEKIEEPWVSLDVVSPDEYIGKIMELVRDKRGVYKNTEYIQGGRVILSYEIPLATILTNFYDKIKSVSSGYASINYEFIGYKKTDVVRLDILVAEELVEALSTIVYRDEAFRQGKEVVNVLKETLPKQMFVLKLQATVGGKIVAAERISARRKDVTAGLYGGDVSRKRKLLDKQKKGKKKMMEIGRGRVEIPPDTFVKILKK
ncbi:translation elongation factor 4 [bacterium]|nr:translation elongation factor 4 [bacterium]